MTKPNQINKWKEYYDFLADNKKREIKEKVMREIACNQVTFYARLKNPQTSFSPADKKAIAKICEVPVSFLFPELENQVA